jgi:hypothetical protein
MPSRPATTTTVAPTPIPTPAPTESPVDAVSSTAEVGVGIAVEVASIVGTGTVETTPATEIVAGTIEAIGRSTTRLSSSLVSQQSFVLEFLRQQ